MGYVATYAGLTVALFLLFYLTGHAATRAFAPLPLDGHAEERAVLRIVIGIGAWVTALFALATLQRLRPAPIGALIGAAAVWGLWSAWKEWTGRGPRPRRRSWALLRSPVALVLFAATAAALAALLAQALRPVVVWDADVYHLTVPRLYLEHGGFRRIPFNVYSNWPLAVQLLFALAMVVKDYILATALHFGFGVSLVAALGWATARVTTPLWGAIAASMLLLHPVFLFEVRVAYVDVACAFFLFAAFLALHRALEDPAGERRWLVLAGIACGVLAASKLNGLFGALCVAAVFVVSRLRGGAALRSLAAPLAVLLAPVALLLAPWLIKTLVLTGNPVYPLLYDQFGGPEWSAALGEAHRSWQQAIGMGRSPLDWLLLPMRVLFMGDEGYEHFDGRLHPAASVLLLIALFGLRREKQAGRALGLALLWFALWSLSSQQMRFLIPILPLLALATAVGLHRLAERWLGRFSRVLAGVTALMVAALLPPANWRFLQQAPGLYSGFASQSELMRAHATDEVFAVIDQRLPADARLLFSNINRGFFCRRDYIADSFFEASQTAALLRQLAADGGVARGLHRLGITHLLIESTPRGVDYPEEFVAVARSPANRTLYRSPDGKYTLIALAAVD
jgi:hypothetical protein